MTHLRTLAPPFLQFVLLSFEGPDLYARAGGLGVRMTGLAQALARRGHPTYHIFVGDPALPERETPAPNLTFFRICGGTADTGSANGVYEREEEKLPFFEGSAPQLVVSEIIGPAAERGMATAIIAEEWQTAHVTCLVSDLLEEKAIRNRVAILWNANNTFGFDRIAWPRLARSATLTTVSRYMKHLMWKHDVNPLVIPNGIPESSVGAARSVRVERLRSSLATNELLLKIGRWTPDKRWKMAIEAVAEERKRGTDVSMVVRGGTDPHGEEVLAYTSHLGLRVIDIDLPIQVDEAIAAFAKAPRGDVYNVKTHLDDELLRVLYTASDAVLANSGHEPFGLVGLEAMAAGGLAVVGSTGEDYAFAGVNSLMLDTEDPAEICMFLARLRSHPDESERLRRNGQDTAKRYAWNIIVENFLLDKLSYAAAIQGADLSLHRTAGIP